MMTANWENLFASFDQMVELVLRDFGYSIEKQTTVEYCYSYGKNWENIAPVDSTVILVLDSRSINLLKQISIFYNDFQVSCEEKEMGKHLNFFNDFQISWPCSF